MALQINEIGIRMQIRDDEGSAVDSLPDPAILEEVNEAQRQEIVDECTSRVLARLKRLQER